MTNSRISLASTILITILLAAGIAILLDRTQSGLAYSPGSPTPTISATLDPLAIPTLPENPTQEDIGKHVYYYNCMPCHGDHGQGMTDTWRQVWEEDHRECWDRGCHGGRIEDEGFPIPTIIPAVILDSDALIRFTNEAGLVAYLKTTHPPQSPGVLSDDNYQAVAAFLWAANHKSDLQPTRTSRPTDQVKATGTVTPTPPSQAQGKGFKPCGSVAIILIGAAGMAMWRQTKSNHLCRSIHSQNSDPFE